MDRATFNQKYNFINLPQVMQQYLDIKYLHLDSLLLYRMGDFYELFFEDALKASQLLGITLTYRNKNDHKNKIHMCGMPYHSVKNYIGKLLNEGFKVALCDQLETADQAKQRGGYKAIVKREVTRIITPGTILDEDMLEDHLPNYLGAVFVQATEASICYVDLSTAKIYLLSLHLDHLLHEIRKLNLKELIISEKHKNLDLVYKLRENNIYINFLPANIFDYDKSEKIILDFYKIFSLESIANFKFSEVIVLGSILEYISLTQKSSIPNISKPNIINSKDFMYIDSFSREKLELTESVVNKKNTVFYHIDKTVSRSGSRLLHRYLSMPLQNKNWILHRLELVEYFYNNIDIMSKIREILKNAPDLERSITKISSGRSNVQDLISTKNILSIAFNLRKILLEEQKDNFLPKFIADGIDKFLHLESIYQLIEDSIDENLLSERKIKLSYHPKVEDLRNSLLIFEEEINLLQMKYRDLTFIDNLKISNNNILGFFVEVNNKNVHKVKDNIFIHKQTNVNNARFITDELKALEYKIENNKSMLVGLEEEIYLEICQKILKWENDLRQLSTYLNKLDVFTAFAYLAYQNDYIKPSIIEDNIINIESGRHLVVEQNLKTKNLTFISNDSYLDDKNQILLITGPNMSGKSTFLKQTAIITILAHIGCFVPAQKATIGIIDKIFTRIGAGDNLAKGESTFMVEMIETSMILNQATEKSLIILDEVGRGTSTYDGVAIAWSILEYIHNKLFTRCLFTTHYHELIDMQNSFPKIINYKTEIHEEEKVITFLHKIVKGSSNKSYGIHVAELAGLPKEVTQGAYNILKNFSSN
ncbi:MAG: DNA mismatch repair protein MutS [Rickettsia sp.]|nr:DNA mismatch repair protein MutS [Rickettsia sp.]